MNYPIIYLPDEVYQIKNIFNNPPEPPEKPDIPKKVYSKKPIKPEKESGFATGFIVSILFILFGLILLANELGGWGAFLTVVGILIFIVVQSSKNTSDRIFEKNQLQYFGEYNKYMNDLLGVDDRFNLQLKNYYENILPEYESNYSKYKEFIDNKESKTYRQKYIFDNLQSFFSSSTKPQEILINVLEGQTEQFFYNYLRNYFFDIVKKNLAIIGDDFERKPYVPDFVIYIEELNLCIDVEIDEPYDINKNPIHIIAGNDMHRNIFFINNKWIVIRFAEIQVIRQPKECCELIQDVINFIYDENETKEINLENIKQQIKKTPCWTESDAIWLASKDFRNLYYIENCAEDIINELLERNIPLLDSIYNEELDDLPF